MRRPVIMQSLVAEYLRSRFSYYALALGVLLTYVTISQVLIIGYTSDNGVYHDLGGYVRQVLFQLTALYWALVTSLAADGVLLQEIGDGSIDLLLTSRANRSRYVFERVAGTLVAVLFIVGAASGAASLLMRASSSTFHLSTVLAPLWLLPCFGLTVSLCALLSASGADRKVGAAAFFLYAAVWFTGSGWFERLWGSSVDRVVCNVLPNIWQCQTAAAKLLEGKALSSMSAWALLNCCVYTAGLFALATWKFKNRDL